MTFHYNIPCEDPEVPSGIISKKKWTLFDLGGTVFINVTSFISFFFSISLIKVVTFFSANKKKGRKEKNNNKKKKEITIILNDIIQFIIILHGM